MPEHIDDGNYLANLLSLYNFILLAITIAVLDTTVFVNVNLGGRLRPIRQGVLRTIQPIQCFTPFAFPNYQPSTQEIPIEAIEEEEEVQEYLTDNAVQTTLFEYTDATTQTELSLLSSFNRGNLNESLPQSDTDSETSHDGYVTANEQHG